MNIPQLSSLVMLLRPDMQQCFVVNLGCLFAQVALRRANDYCFAASIQLKMNVRLLHAADIHDLAEQILLYCHPRHNCTNPIISSLVDLKSRQFIVRRTHFVIQIWIVFGACLPLLNNFRAFVIQFAKHILPSHKFQIGFETGGNNNRQQDTQEIRTLGNFNVSLIKFELLTTTDKHLNLLVELIELRQANRLGSDFHPIYFAV